MFCLFWGCASWAPSRGEGAHSEPGGRSLCHDQGASTTPTDVDGNDRTGPGLVVQEDDGGGRRNCAYTIHKCRPLFGQWPALLTELGLLPAVSLPHHVDVGVDQGRRGFRGPAQRARCRFRQG